MAILDKNSIKGFFSAGKQPTAAQYQSLIESAISQEETGSQYISSSLTITGPVTMSRMVIDNIRPTIGESGTVGISGSLNVSGSLTANGSIIIGDADTDSVSFGAEISSSITPDADKSYSLGSLSKSWKDVHSGQVLISRNVDEDLYLTGSALEVTGSSIFGGLLDSGSYGSVEWHASASRPGERGTMGVFDNFHHFVMDQNSTNLLGNDFGYSNHHYIGNEILSQFFSPTYNRVHFLLTSSGHIGVGFSATAKPGPSAMFHVNANASTGSVSQSWAAVKIEGNTSVANLNALEVIGTSSFSLITGSITFINDITVTNDATFNSNIIGNPLGGTDLSNIATASFKYISSSLIPSSDNIFNLGSSTKQWKVGHITTASLGRINPKNNGTLIVSGSIC